MGDDMKLQHWRHRVSAALGGLAAITAMVLAVSHSAKAADDDQYRIPLKLFGGFEIEGGIGACHFALWQRDKDPETDKYAYLFYMDFDGDGAPMPARLEVGSDVLQLDELVRDGTRIAGMAVHSLYATPDRDVRVHIEVQDATDEGGVTRIDKASIYVTQSGKLPFRANAKGIFGCPEAGKGKAAEVASAGWSGPEGLPVSPPRLLDAPSEIPAELRSQIRQYAADDCDLDGFHGWSGAVYPINENFLLWEAPCFSGPYQASSVFGITQNPPQDWAEVLSLPNPPGLEGNSNYGAMNAKIDPAAGLLRVTALNRGTGDCGVHQVFRLIDGPGEVLEFELLEYREKIDCDGIASAPEAWPLAYRNY